MASIEDAMCAWCLKKLVHYVRIYTMWIDLSKWNMGEKGRPVINDIIHYEMWEVPLMMKMGTRIHSTHRENVNRCVGFEH